MNVYLRRPLGSIWVLLLLPTLCWTIILHFSIISYFVGFRHLVKLPFLFGWHGLKDKENQWILQKTTTTTHIHTQQSQQTPNEVIKGGSRTTVPEKRIGKDKSFDGIFHSYLRFRYLSKHRKRHQPNSNSIFFLNRSFRENAALSKHGRWLLQLRSTLSKELWEDQIWNSANNQKPAEISLNHQQLGWSSTMINKTPFLGVLNK